jgi:hypothetical protein
MATTGFLFAFVRYNYIEKPTLIQRAVRLVVCDETIHVAMLPVRHYETHPVPRIWVEPHAYTAFVKYGACVHPAEHILDDPSYDFVFLRVPDPVYFNRGMDLLERMKTAHYNYATLIFAVLPNLAKGAHMRLPDWLTGEDALLHTPSHPHKAITASEFKKTVVDNKNSNNKEEEEEHKTPAIFCSQLGMLLCYECGALDERQWYDPAVCLPAELEAALLHGARGIRCPRECIRIAPSAPPGQPIPRMQPAQLRLG